MYSTVYEMVETGVITPKLRTTSDDLELAATWLEAYEGDIEDSPEILITMASVAAKLRKEVNKRKSGKDK
jgi:hypothetical protein